jgi:hypothetical protein
VNQAELTRVPFYFQDAYECGPVSLAMVTGAGAGAVEVEVEAHVLLDALVEQVYLPGRQDLL